MSDSRLIWIACGYAFSCFVAAAIAKEFFNVTESDADGFPAHAMCGIFWPLVTAFWACVGAFVVLWWLANTPIRVIANHHRKRRTALAEVERLLR